MVTTTTNDACRKVALVTGGSAGLGAAIARMLATELDMSVIINYHDNVERAESLVRELRDGYTARHPAETTAPSKYAAVRADLSVRSEVLRLVEQATRISEGRLDVVVSNFGWTRIRDFANLDDGVHEDDWDRCFASNVKSHLFLFHAVRKFLEQGNERELGSAVFISTASVAGLKPGSGSSLAYAVTKAALIHLVKALAVIAAPSIRVNSISPGLVLTDWALDFPPDKVAAAEQLSKLKRFATVEDVAEQVRAFVLSKSITGHNAIIDGGFHL